jgi:hypothetical protein
MRRFCRTDANQRDVVKALQALGCSVLDLSPLGFGAPDLLIGATKLQLGGAAGRLNILLEDKDGKKSPSKRRLTDFQEDFHAGWRGQVDVVNSVEEAISIVTKYRRLGEL